MKYLLTLLLLTACGHRHWGPDDYAHARSSLQPQPSKEESNSWVGSIAEGIAEWVTPKAPYEFQREDHP